MQTNLELTVVVQGLLRVHKVPGQLSQVAIKVVVTAMLVAAREHHQVHNHAAQRLPVAMEMRAVATVEVIVVAE